MPLPYMPVYTRLAITRIWLAAMLLAASALAWGDEETSIAVIYPDLGEPYREVFAKIIEGIEDKAGTPVARHPLRSDTDIDSLKSGLRRQNARVVIALGRQGMKIASALDSSISVVVGGVLTVPENETHGRSIISLSPDPALLFARMKGLMPATKRVFVVYDPAVNGWLMKLAKEAARTQGLELVVHEARDLRGAVRSYQEIFSAFDSHQDVLWLPQDSATVEEGSVLPLVLQESWNRNLAVFSSSFGHVRRGVLFSLYPDNVALGRSLAGLAQEALAKGNHEKPGMMTLRDVQIAVNLRTAKHLRLNLSQRQQDFDMIFPE